MMPSVKRPNLDYAAPEPPRRPTALWTIVFAAAAIVILTFLLLKGLGL